MLRLHVFTNMIESKNDDVIVTLKSWNELKEALVSLEYTLSILATASLNPSPPFKLEFLSVIFPFSHATLPRFEFTILTLIPLKTSDTHLELKKYGLFLNYLQKDHDNCK